MDERRKQTALTILEKASSINSRVANIERVIHHLNRHDEMLKRNNVRLSARTQQHSREILNELRRMIAEYKHQKQCIINVINSIIESSRLEEGARTYLTLRYIEGMSHERIAEEMYLSSDHLKRKKKMYYMLFYDALESMPDDVIQSLLERKEQ